MFRYYSVTLSVRGCRLLRNGYWFTLDFLGLAVKYSELIYLFNMRLNYNAKCLIYLLTCFDLAVVVLF